MSTAIRIQRTAGAAAFGQRGFTLIELMVGVLLAMVTVVLIAQVYAVSEGRKRTTASGADAQVGGTVALYSIARDLQTAGYGIAVNPAGLGCPMKAQRGGGGVQTITLAPVVITAATEKGTDQSDKITMLKSSVTSFSVPMLVTEDHPTTTNYFVVRSSMGVKEGDMLAAVPKEYDPATGCTAIQVQGDGASNKLGDTNIPHALNATDAPWNTNALSLFPAGGYGANSYLVNLGNLAYRTYQVSSNQSLQAIDMTVADAEPPKTGIDLAPNVVMVKALYGKDTDGDGSADSFDRTTPTNATDWARVVAVRVVVVTRSAQLEKGRDQGSDGQAGNTDAVTTKKIEWDVGANAAASLGTKACSFNSKSQCLTLSLDWLGADWDHYRYRVFDTVVPVRNAIWNS